MVSKSVNSGSVLYHHNAVSSECAVRAYDENASGLPAMSSNMELPGGLGWSSGGGGGCRGGWWAQHRHVMPVS